MNSFTRYPSKLMAFASNKRRNSFILITSSLVRSSCYSRRILFHGVALALDNLGFASYKSNCINAMETAQEEMAQKRKKLHRKPTSIYSQEELRRQQEILFEQVSETMRDRFRGLTSIYSGSRRTPTDRRRRLGTNTRIIQGSFKEENGSNTNG